MRVAMHQNSLRFVSPTGFLLALLVAVFASGLAGAAENADPPSETPRQYRLFAMDGSGEVTIQELKGQYTALHFLLKTECLFCLMHTRTYALQGEMYPEVRHLFIKPDEEAAIERWTESLLDEASGAPPGLEVPAIYRDPHGSVARHLRITHGYEYHGELMRFPAFVLIDPDGTEVYRYIGQNTGDRFGFERFANLMQAIERPFRIESFNLMENSQVPFGGYDPVAYLDEEAAVPGDPELTYDHHGMMLRFANEENRTRFVAEPERYLLAYGGWCALGMTDGEMHEVDYKNFLIQDGRVYLFRRGTLTNARTIWRRDADGNRAKADAHWMHISGQRTSP